MNRLLQDLFYAARTLRKDLGFTLMALATLAIGIGANTAIFSVIEAVLLRPLPYKDPGRLALLRAADPQDPEAGISYRTYEACKSQSQAFEDLAVFYRDTGWSRVTLTGIDEPESVQGAFVSSNFFALMGVAPLIGRSFTAAEEASRDRVVVLSRELWRRQFGGSQDVIGKMLQINGMDSQVIGVMPPTFQFPTRNMQFWAPITTNGSWLDPATEGRVASHSRNFYMRWNAVGRLRVAVTDREAQLEIDSLASRLEQADPDFNVGLGLRVTPLRVELAANMRLALLVLFGAVIFVLLIACTNVANLVLARGRTREREIAIRSALGAGRARLVSQMLIESLALGFMSGLLGVVIALLGIRALVSIGPPDLPRLNQAGIDIAVLGFTLAVSLLAAIVFGLAPALKISRIDPNESLRSGGRGSSASAGLMRTRGLLVVVEFALSMVLLTGAGLLVRSFIAVQAVDPGFHPERVLTMLVTQSGPGAAASRIARSDVMLERVRALPGVQAAGAIDGLFELDATNTLGLRAIEGHSPEPRDQWTPLTWKTVTGDYFDAMGAPLLKGRFFSSQDGPGSPLVAIVDQSLARRYWPDGDPIGKRFKGQDARGKSDDWITVIGLVGDMRRHGLERQPTPHVFEWYRQSGIVTPDLVVRATGDPRQLGPALHSAVRELDKTAILSGVTTVEQQLAEQLAPRRFQTWLLGLFSLVALLMASVGTYGVMHYSVEQRTQEIGVRMALGAAPSAVLRMVIGRGLLLAAAGLGLGLIGAWWLTWLISSLLFGVTASDPATFAAVSLMLAAMAVLASLVPAWRAARVDPLLALRHE